MEGLLKQKELPKDSEQLADVELNALIDEYPFLETIPKNREALESAETAVEALRIAKQRVAERQARSFRYSVPLDDESAYEQVQFSLEGIKRVFHEIRHHSREIGSGGDAIVLVAEYEDMNGGSPVCYKQARIVGLHRGRNTPEVELSLQSDFYNALKDVDSLRIGVPEPYYFSEMDDQRIIAMERLRARSIDELLRGFGGIPTWVTEVHIDVFCDELLRTIDIFHKKGLFHRDLHLGNIMFTQLPEESEKLGYIIDFGVSSHGVEGMDPYKDSVRGETLTYSDDYGKIEKVRSELKNLVRSRV